MTAIPGGARPWFSDIMRVLVTGAAGFIGSHVAEALADLPLYDDTNVTGTAVLLNAMGRRGVSRLVLASSMAVYGEGAYECLSGSCPASVVRPLPRAVTDLAAGAFDPRCPSCGSVMAVSRVPEDAIPGPRTAYATYASL